MKLLKVDGMSGVGDVNNGSAPIPLPTADQLDLAAAHLVFNYLAQHCFAESAAAFLSQWLGERDSDPTRTKNDPSNGASQPVTHPASRRLSSQEEFAARSLEYRRHAQGLIIDGRIAEAIEYLDEYFPNVLGGTQMEDAATASATATATSESYENACNLRFELLCQQFVETIRRGAFSDALEFTEITLSPMAHNNPALQARLQDVVVLLAYTEPAESPVKHLLSPRLLESLAEQVNAAILGQGESSLETVIKQMILVSTQLAGPGRVGKMGEFDDDSLRVSAFLLEPMNE